MLSSAHSFTPVRQPLKQRFMPVLFVDLLRLLCHFPLNFDILPFYILGVKQDSESEQSVFFVLFFLNRLNFPFLTIQHAQPDTAFVIKRMTTYSASVTLLKYAVNTSFGGIVVQKGSGTSFRQRHKTSSLRMLDTTHKM